MRCEGKTPLIKPNCGVTASPHPPAGTGSRQGRFLFQGPAWGHMSPAVNMLCEEENLVSVEKLNKRMEMISGEKPLREPWASQHGHIRGSRPQTHSPVGRTRTVTSCDSSWKAGAWVGAPSAQPLRPGRAAGPVVGPPPLKGRGAQTTSGGAAPSFPPSMDWVQVPHHGQLVLLRLWLDPVGARAVGLNSSCQTGSAAAPVCGLRANRPARQLQGHTSGSSRREPYTHWRQARRGTSARPLCRSAAWDRGSPLPRPLPLSSCTDAFS